MFCLVVVNDPLDWEREVVQSSLEMFTTQSASTNIPRGTSDTTPDDGGRKRVREGSDWS